MNISLARETTGCDDASEAMEQAAATLPLQPSGGRALGPDVARAGAALLVVYLHACVPYLTHPMPGLVWAVQDDSSRLVSAVFWAIELFIMPLFLLLAGFFAYRSWAKGAGASFILSRARRLLIPLLAAAVLLLPLDYYVWLTGWVIDGQLGADRLWKFKVPREQREHLLGLGHLWFLLYVFLYCGVLTVAARYCGSLNWLRLLRDKISHRPWAAGLTALMVGGWATLVVAPEVVFGFQHAFLPVPTKWLYSGTFFFGGVLIACYDPRWTVINQLAARLVVGGAVLGGTAVVLGQWAIQRCDLSTLAFDIGFASRALLATVTVAAAWSMALGLIGAANRLAPGVSRLSYCSRGVSTLAAASFWIYLLHHPLVALIQIDIKLLFPQISPAIKSLMAAAGAVGCCLGSYHLLQRLFGYNGQQAGKQGRNEASEPSDLSEPCEPPTTQDIHRLPSSATVVRRAA